MKQRLILSILTVLLTFGLMAQKKKKYDYGPDSANCVMNISLYEGDFEQKLYDDAMRSWRKCIAICPKSRKSLYINGVKMFRYYIKKAEDEATKMAYVDSLMWIYDHRIVHFGQKGYVLGRKGADHFKYFKNSNSFGSYLILKESVEESKEKSEAVVLSTYYNSMYKAYRQNKVEKADLFTEYLTVGDYIATNIRTIENEKKRGKYEKAKNNLDEFFIKFAKCEDIVKIFGEKVDADPDDFELKKKALKVMNRRGCDDSDFYLQVAEDVHAKEPAAEAAYAIAVMKAKRSDVGTCLNYFEEAIELCDGCPDIVNYYVKAGKAAVATRQYAKARSFANSVLKMEPNNGQAIVIIGDAILGTPCNDGKAGAYSSAWLAFDYYARAKAKDPSVSEKAAKRMRTCSARYPENAQVFMLGIKEGESYTHCNGETTTVRIKK